MAIIIVSQTTYKKIKNHKRGNALWDESGVTFLSNGKVSVTISQDTRDELGTDPETAILDAMRVYERDKSTNG